MVAPLADIHDLWYTPLAALKIKDSSAKVETLTSECRPVVPVDKEIYVKCEEFDDEVHFLMVCKKCISIRKDLSEKVCISNPLVTQLRGRELFREHEDYDRFRHIGVRCKFVHRC